MNAFSMPTKTAPTLLQNFAYQLYNLSQENPLQTIKIGKSSSYKGSLDYSIRKGIGKPCARRVQNRDKRDKLTICSISQRNQTDPFQPHRRICKHCCRLPPTKDIPQPFQYRRRRQPHRLPRINHNKNSRSHNIKNIMEQNH